MNEGWRALLLVGWMGAWVLPLAGCSNAAGDHGDGSGDGDPVSAGGSTFTLAWTVAGVAAANECDDEGASALQLDVYSQDGTHQGTYAASCSAFTLLVSLPAARYSATAELLDPTGAARTTTVDVEPFDVVDGANFTAPIDFPVTSFK